MATPTSTMTTAATTWTRRPHTRRDRVRAGPDVVPKNDIKKMSKPIVTAKIENAWRPVRNPPTPVAKTATAARKGAVQPTPTATKPAPNR